MDAAFFYVKEPYGGRNGGIGAAFERQPPPFCCLHAAAVWLRKDESQRKGRFPRLFSMEYCDRRGKMGEPARTDYKSVLERAKDMKNS